MLFLAFHTILFIISSLFLRLLNNRSSSTMIIGVLQDVCAGLSLVDVRNVPVMKAQRPTEY